MGNFYKDLKRAEAVALSMCSVKGGATFEDCYREVRSKVAKFGKEAVSEILADLIYERKIVKRHDGIADVDYYILRSLSEEAQSSVDAEVASLGLEVRE